MCATESDRDFLSSTDPRKKVAKKEDLVGVRGFEPRPVQPLRWDSLVHVLMPKPLPPEAVWTPISTCFYYVNWRRPPTQVPNKSYSSRRSQNNAKPPSHELGDLNLSLFGQSFFEPSTHGQSRCCLRCSRVRTRSGVRISPGAPFSSYLSFS